MTDVIHKLALERICPANWTSWDFEVLLLGEASTAAPVLTDLYVADLVPALNELEHTAYTRLAATAITPTWETTYWKQALSALTWSGLDQEALVTQGVTGAALYVKETNDADSWLVCSGTFAQVDLDGTDFTLTVDATGALSVAQG